MENWPTAGGWPTTGLYPPDGSYGGGHGDNHYLPGGGDSPIGDLQMNRTGRVGKAVRGALLTSQGHRQLPC